MSDWFSFVFVPIACGLVASVAIFWISMNVPDQATVCAEKAKALHLLTYDYNKVAGCVVYYKGGYTVIDNVGKYR